MLLKIGHGNSDAEPDQHVEQPGAGGVQQQSGYGQLRVGKQSSCAQKESRAGDVAGNRSFDSLQFLPAIDADFAHAPINLCSEGL